MRQHGKLGRARRHGVAATTILALAWSSACTTAQNHPAPADKPTAKAPAPVLNPRQRATAQVLSSAQSRNEFLRANAIEAAQALPDRVVPLAQLGLDDPAPVVRFTALCTVGKLRLTTLAGAARSRLEDKDPSVRAAAMYALRACGQKIDISPMAALLDSPDPHVGANVAMLLGLIGDPSAIPLLREKANLKMMRVSEAQEAAERVQIAEAMARLGDDDALTTLRSDCYSPYGDVQVLAIQAIGRTGDHRMERGLGVMLAGQPLEIELAAAESLARLGKYDGLALLVEGTTLPLPTARAQAAMALALFSDQRAEQALEKLLDDPEELVRLSAAASLLRREHPLAQASGR